MSELPLGWGNCFLEECVNILDSLRKPINNKERQLRIANKEETELYPYFGATSQVGYIDGYLFDGEYVALGEDGVPFFDPTKHKAYMLIGKTWVNNHAHVLDGASGINNRYLCYLLNQIDYHGYVNGATRLKLTQQSMRRLPISMAPLNEQIRIANKLDSLLAKVDSAQTRLEKIPTLLKRFRQSVLAVATSGELTREWREEKKLNLTREEILSAHREGWIIEKLKAFEIKGKQPKNQNWKDKYPEPYTPTEEDISLFGNSPSNWSFCSLGELTRFVKDGPHYSPKYTESGVPFISGRNITQSGIDFSTCKYISDELHIELSKRCKPLKGDILYTKGGTTGIACVNDINFDFNVWVHVAVLRVSNDNIIYPSYVNIALNSPQSYERSQFYTHGVANRDLGLKRMIKICFPLPHIEEQQEIVRRVESLFTLADTVEKQYQTAKQRLDRLSQSILAKAFRGELVPQDPNDEPASELLKRIQAERAAQSKTKPTRKKMANKEGVNL